MADDDSKTYDDGRKRAGFVYFIQADTLKLIKIGVAGCPFTRLITLQTGSPDELVLLGAVPDADAEWLERHLHHRFRDHRQHGEWFRPADELTAYILANAQLYDASGLLPGEPAPSPVPTPRLERQRPEPRPAPAGRVVGGPKARLAAYKAARGL